MKIKITTLFFFVVFSLNAQQTFNIPFPEHRIIDYISCDNVHDPQEYLTSIGVTNLLNDPIEVQFRTIESHVPTGWNFNCNGDWMGASNCFTNLNSTGTIQGGQRVWIDHNIQFLSAPEKTDSITAKVEVLNPDFPDYKDTIEMKVVFVVFDLQQVVEIDSDIQFSRDERVFVPGSGFSPISFGGEILNPYNDKAIQWEETFSYIPPDWEFDCAQRNSATDDFCQKTNGTINFNCRLDFRLNIEYNITKIGTKRDSMIKRWVMYDPDDRAATEVEFGFTIVKCPLFAQADIINFTGPTSFCAGEEITLSVDPNLPNVRWMVDGERFSGVSSITVPAGELITVTSSDDIGCQVSDTLELEVQTPYEEQICVITSDSLSGNNLIVWEKTDGEGTVYFKVYRESIIIGEYDSIGVVSFDQLSFFEDDAVDPRVTSYQYKISAVDDCGNESELSTPHKTLHLTSSQGVNGEVNLIWDNYQGIPFSTVNILTGPNLDSMKLLTQRPSNSFTYTDLNPQTDPVFYQIEIILDDACTARKTATDFFSIRSNAVSYGSSSVSNVYLNSKVQVFPNPTSDFFFLENDFDSRLDYSISNMSGKVLQTGFAKARSSEKVQVDLPKGIYYLIGKSEEGVVSKKLIFN